MKNKTIIALVAILAICGCLPVMVLVGGGTAYLVLHEAFGFSDQDLGVSLPDFNAPSLLDQPAEQENVPDGQPPQPADQGSAPQPQGTEEGRDYGQASRDCARFAPVFPQYALISATQTDHLTCAFGVAGTYDYLATIEITKFATASEASQSWASEWGPDSEYAKQVAEDMQYVDRITYSNEGDHFLKTYRNNPEAGITTYSITAGRQYDDSIIEFSDHKAADTSGSTWEMVEGLAQQLVDEKNR